MVQERSIPSVLADFKLQEDYDVRQYQPHDGGSRGQVEVENIQWAYGCGLREPVDRDLQVMPRFWWQLSEERILRGVVEVDERRDSEGNGIFARSQIVPSVTRRLSTPV